MFIQTQVTPNPNALKFIPGKKVSLAGSLEVLYKKETNNELLKNIFSIDGVVGIYISDDFLSVNKKPEFEWEDIKHIIISLINEFYENGDEYVIGNKKNEKIKVELKEIEKEIIKILDTKIRPAVAKDGGDIQFKEYKDGIVKVQLQGSCSGCPSSTMTLKQGVKNLLCHYIPEVKSVEAI